MCNRKGFASNEMTTVFVWIHFPLLSFWGARHQGLKVFICLEILLSKLFVEVHLHQPAFVRQFIVSFVWCLCDLVPSVAGAVVYFLNPTLPPLWGGWSSLRFWGFDLIIVCLHGLDSLCRFLHGQDCLCRFPGRCSPPTKGFIKKGASSCGFVVGLFDLIASFLLRGLTCHESGIFICHRRQVSATRDCFV